MRKKLLTLLMIVSSLLFIYTAGFGSFSTMTQRAVHWFFMTSAVFLSWKHATRFGGGLSVAAALGTGGVAAYLIVVWPQRIHLVTAFPLTDYLMGGLALLLLIVSVYKTVGAGLGSILIFFLIYALFGPYFPGFLGHSGTPLKRLIPFLYLTSEGIFGVALGISATYIVSFVIFGAFLHSFGGGEWFVDFSFATAGRFRGGPAKTAVCSSALMGMVSGSPVANVATTGVFTIPLMKRVGYQPVTAGAIEAVASSGGMFLPPVMGAGAFIMAEYLDVSYLEVIRAALVPAVLYYIALLLIVDIRAVKSNITGLPREELPSLKERVIKRGYLALPLIALIVLVVSGENPLIAAFYAILLCVVTGLFNALFSDKAPENFCRFFGNLKEALYKGSLNVIPVAVSCAGAGIIVGVLGVTGLGTKIADGLLQIAGGNVLLALFFTMIAAIILGMGMPVTAVYIILAATLTAPLIELGVLPMAAHLFIFMFSSIAGLTPPVAITSYAAAAIAEAEPNRVAIRGFFLGLSGYIIPYLFVYRPGLILYGGPVEILLSLGSGLLGIVLLTHALEGSLFSKYLPVARLFGKVKNLDGEWAPSSSKKVSPQSTRKRRKK